jgi:hypothetical protein
MVSSGSLYFLSGRFEETSLNEPAAVGIAGVIHIMLRIPAPSPLRFRGCS